MRQGIYCFEGRNMNEINAQVDEWLKNTGNIEIQSTVPFLGSKAALAVTYCEISEELAPEVPAVKPFVTSDNISEMLFELGIPAHLKGFRFLRKAIELVTSDNRYLDGLTKELYPQIAMNFATTDAKVERAIRHALETSWERKALTNLHPWNYKPGIGEFLAVFIEKVTLPKAS